MPPTPPNPSSAPATPPGFDKRSLLKYVKYIGRPYRERAAKLVSICRTFVQAQDQTPDSYYKLRSALQLVDDALMSATKAREKTSEEADDAFEKAVSELGRYEREHHPKKIVAESTIKEAEKVDKSSLKGLNRLREKFRPLEEGPTTEVDFLIHKSLPDNKPTVVTQVLCSKSNQNEILWNFGRFEGGKRLTLKQNPHFYNALPTSPEKYGDNFLTVPESIETCLHKRKIKRISVLTDSLGQAGRVFLKTAKQIRAFGNVWVPKNAIIFKDVCGNLEGESRVGKAIQDTPNLWCFTEPPPLSRTSPSSPSSIRSSPSPTTAPTPTTCSKGLLLTDWREPIRQMLRSPDVNIRISTKPPISSIPRSPAPSSAQSGFSSSVGSLPPTGTPQSSELPPAELPPRSPARPSPRPPPEPPAHPSPEPPARPPPELPSQHPGPRFQHNVARNVTPDPLPQQHVQTAVLTLQIPAPQAQKRKKNWFQKHVYDYGK